MEESKITMVELYKNTGIPVTTIQRLKNDPKSNPTINSLKPIADFFNLTVDKLISGEITKNTKEKSSYKENKTHWTKIPLLTWKEAINWETHIKSKEKRQTVLTDINISDEAYALKLDTNLEDGFRKNAIIIADPTLEPENLDYVISYKENSKIPALKQLQEYDNAFYLKPLISGFSIDLFTKEYSILGVIKQIKLDFL